VQNCDQPVGRGWRCIVKRSGRAARCVRERKRPSWQRRIRKERIWKEESNGRDRELGQQRKLRFASDRSELEARELSRNRLSIVVAFAPELTSRKTLAALGKSRGARELRGRTPRGCRSKSRLGRRGPRGWLGVQSTDRNGKNRSPVETWRTAPARRKTKMGPVKCAAAEFKLEFQRRLRHSDDQRGADSDKMTNRRQLPVAAQKTAAGLPAIG